LPNTRNSRENVNFLLVRLQKDFEMLISVIVVNTGGEYMDIILKQLQEANCPNHWVMVFGVSFELL